MKDLRGKNSMIGDDQRPWLVAQQILYTLCPRSSNFTPNNKPRLSYPFSLTPLFPRPVWPKYLQLIATVPSSQFFLYCVFCTCSQIPRFLAHQSNCISAFSSPAVSKICIQRKRNCLGAADVEVGVMVEEGFCATQGNINVESWECKIPPRQLLYILLDDDFIGIKHRHVCVQLCKSFRASFVSLKQGSLSHLQHLNWV